MDLEQNEALRDLLRRVDEVRGLSDPTDCPPRTESIETQGLIETLGELVNELERSHRRLIETNVQLVSLREVASATVNALDAAETARLVTRYLSSAFGFDDAFLLLVEKDAERLEGAWTHGDGTRQHTYGLELPLIGQYGAISRSLWLNRTITHHAARRHVPADLPAGHPLEDVLERVGSYACVPLRRSTSHLPAAPHELCGARCILGDVAAIAPPAGPEAENWLANRDEREKRCLNCELLPALGVIGFARRSDAPAITSGDVALIESIALSIAPMVENAALYQQLRRSERFREHVLDSMASALVAVNMKGEVLTFNRAAGELLGFKQEEAIGEPIGALLGSDAESLLAETLEHGREALRVETQVRAHDGSAVPVSYTTSLLRDERRHVYGAIATFVDLTPLKRAEEHARRLDRLAALGRFTSSVAHEIRNPLAGIGAGIQYMSRALGKEGPQAENLAFILSEIRRLDRIVEDLFSITHPRGLQIHVAPLEDALKRALLSVDSLIQERHLTVRLDVTPRTPPVAYDADQIQQVFINLVKNAVEASPGGTGITITIGPMDASPRAADRAPAFSGPGVIARVQDQGGGISPEHLKTIFEPFFTTKPGGTGLGLYISHDIVKRHGGSLTVTSEARSGATFIVELPLEHNGGHP
jgi:PAS domain S-box-containing protein